MEKVNMYDPKRHYNQNKERYEKNMKAVLSHGKFINGPEIKDLEQILSKYVGTKYSLGVSSGTDALLIALMALDVGINDEVVTVPFTWISTAEVICLLKAKPVFCDVDERTFNMDPKSLEKVITKNTKVVMPVSLFGQMYDVEKVKEVVTRAEKKYNKKIYIIEDGAQSFGAISKSGNSCGVSDIGCTSFFPSKPLGCFGDGGMCFTNDEKLYQNMIMIKNHGCKKRYQYEKVGINGRLDTLQASVLLSKIPDMSDQFNRRDDNAEYYNVNFSDLKDVVTPYKSDDTIRHVYAQYTIILKDKEVRDKLERCLSDKQIGYGEFYPVCLHLVPVITEEYKKGDLPVSEKLAERVLSLPCYPELLKEERERVMLAVRDFFNVVDK
jgi:UDP-2-acetamido-2-deoxy-ribo-hexuluronate aminotransferase